MPLPPNDVDYLPRGERLWSFVAPLLLSDDAVAQGSAWRCPVPLRLFLELHCRTPIFLVQETVDPLFTLSPPFHLPEAADRRFVRKVNRRILDTLVSPIVQFFVPAESN